MEQQNLRIKELITLGREQGFLTYAEINDHMPEDPSDPLRVEDVVQMIKDAGIPVLASAPETTQPALIPADQVKPEDIGTLSIEYRDGQPVIVVSGGKYIPTELTAVDGAGNTVAAYSGGPVRTERRADGLYDVSFYTNRIVGD